MSILSQVAIQWYVDRMLYYKLNTEIFERLRYKKKLEGLEELKIINSNLKNKLNIIYDIRNIYAHEVDVKEKRVEDLLKKIKKMEYNSGMWKNYGTKKLFLLLSQKYIKFLQRSYLKLHTDDLEKKFC